MLLACDQSDENFQKELLGKNKTKTKYKSHTGKEKSVLQVRTQLNLLPGNKNWNPWKPSYLWARCPYITYRLSYPSNENSNHVIDPSLGEAHMIRIKGMPSRPLR